MTTAVDLQIQQTGQAPPPVWNGQMKHEFPPSEETETPRSQDGMAVSEEEYWEFYYRHLDFNYEWNNGILEEKPMAKVRGSVQYQWFCLVLGAYLETHPLAQMVNLEIGFRLALTEKTSIRKPDLFVVRHNNPVPLHEDDANFAGICDLCVESLSDSKKREIERDTKTKKEEYEGVGVREYYILDSEGRYTTFYHLLEDGSYAVIPINADGVLCSQVLPGFQFRIRDLYLQPSLIEMAEDEVYRHFVLPEYQAEKQRAAEADARAEQERLRADDADARAVDADARAEQERQRAAAADARAERFAAQLRALGLLNK